MRSRRSFLKVGGAFAALIPVAGCVVRKSSSPPPPSHKPPPPPPAHKPAAGPPAHAPAHGRRRKHHYQYYPDSCVYFDIDRKVYFYLDGGNWRTSATLPGGIVLGATAAVSLELDHATPYVEFHAHKSKYPGKKGHIPPGQAKKGGGAPGKGKGKGKGKKK